MSDDTLRDTYDKIRSEETWHTMVGTSKIYFDEGEDRYSIRSAGPRYLVAVNARPGRIGSIIIPETYRTTETSGFIVGVGDGEYDPKTGKRTPPPLEIGDRVLFSAYAGSKVELGGKEFRILQYDSIIGVLTPEGKAEKDED